MLPPLFTGFFVKLAEMTRQKKRHKKRAEPIHYSDAVADEIVTRLGRGEPLANICRDAHMPFLSTVYDWMETKEDFGGRIARAREAGEDHILAECMDIADKTQLGQVTKDTPKGTETTKADMIEHRKLRIYTRLQLLAKWNPKKFGDKIDLNVGGTLGLADAIRDGRERARTGKTLLADDDKNQ